MIDKLGYSSHAYKVVVMTLSLGGSMSDVTDGLLVKKGKDEMYVLYGKCLDWE